MRTAETIKASAGSAKLGEQTSAAQRELLIIELLLDIRELMVELVERVPGGLERENLSLGIPR